MVSLKQWMVYHRTFHHTFALHINHLIFLNSYLFGVSLLLNTISPYAVIPVFAAYSLYAMNLMSSRSHFQEVLTGALYICIVGCIAVGAYFCNEHLMTELGKTWKKIMVDVGIILGSFMMQILGHCLFEEFHAPPDLIHGFVAAPLLEFVSLVFRLGFLRDLCVEVNTEVQKVRADARYRRSVLSSQNKGAGSLLAEIDQENTSDGDVLVGETASLSSSSSSLEKNDGNNSSGHIRKRSGNGMPI
jgi:uncharacterized membrane protein YGL010W